MHGSATLRTTIHDRIVLALRNDLKVDDCLPPAVFSGLLDALGSVLLLSPSAASVSATTAQAKSIKLHVGHNNVNALYQSTAPSTKAALSLPELVKWTYERYRTCSTISISLIRFIGRICSENSFVRNNQWRVACRKTFAAIKSEEVLDTMMSCCATTNTPAVRALALSSLWFVLHRSERARTYVKSKRFLNFPPTQNSKANVLDENEKNFLYAEKMVRYLIHENQTSPFEATE